MRDAVAGLSATLGPASEVLHVFRTHGRLVPASMKRALWRQGDPVDAVFLLEEGAILLEHQTLEGGLELRFVSSPMVLGLAEYLLGAEHNVTPKVYENVRIWSLPVDRIPGLLAKPECAVEFLRWQVTTSLAPKTHRPFDRVWAVLNQMKTGRPMSCDNPWVLLPSLSQEKIAEMAGVSRRTVCRALRQLRMEGLIKMSVRKLMIRA